MVVWDSQVQDGYKRSKDTADSEQSSRKGPRPAAAAWDGTKSSSVVEELLKNASDKAYGTEGEVHVALFVCTPQKSFSLKVIGLYSV